MQGKKDGGTFVTEVARRCELYTSRALKKNCRERDSTWVEGTRAEILFTVKKHGPKKGQTENLSHQSLASKPVSCKEETDVDELINLGLEIGSFSTTQADLETYSVTLTGLKHLILLVELPESWACVAL